MCRVGRGRSLFGFGLFFVKVSKSFFLFLIG